MWHPKTVKFDSILKALFEEVDHYIEDKYGCECCLHPNRPKRGETSNPEADGLFNIGGVFTPGFRSELGRGYIIDLSISTLKKIDGKIKREIYVDAVNKSRELLPKYFPDRELTIQCEGNLFKILGDFSLGNA